MYNYFWKSNNNVMRRISNCRKDSHYREFNSIEKNIGEILWKP